MRGALSPPLRDQVSDLAADRLAGMSVTGDLEGVVAAGDPRESGVRASRDDTLEGGRGEDLLDGGPGRDRLNGGFGEDSLSGGSGDDVLTSLGGGRDEVNCGPGNDRVIADRSDTVINCERRG